MVMLPVGREYLVVFLVVDVALAVALFFRGRPLFFFEVTDVDRLRRLAPSPPSRPPPTAATDASAWRGSAAVPNRASEAWRRDWKASLSDGHALSCDPIRWIIWPLALGVPAWKGLRGA